MKRLIGGLVGILAIFEIALFVYAEIEASCPPGIFHDFCVSEKRPEYVNKISLMIQVLFFGIFVIAVSLLAAGGIQWVNSKGNKTKISHAKKAVIAGTILIIFLAFAYYIVQVVAANFYAITPARTGLPQL
jgi:hypothetical protein